MTLNALADQTPAELATLRSTKYAPSAFPIARLSAAAGGNPSSFDWRTKGAVSKVKNQGGCGSCWAFSATETVESHYQLASGKLLELAPQTYVNCVKNPNSCGGTGGCQGATVPAAGFLPAPPDPLHTDSIRTGCTHGFGGARARRWTTPRRGPADSPQA